MTLRFGEPGTAAAEFQRDVTSRRPFLDVLAVLRQAIDLVRLDPRAPTRPTRCGSS
jgi:hypothetical protein